MATLWKWFWRYLVPKRVKKEYQYVGYIMWWLDGQVKNLQEEIDEDDYESPINCFEKGRLSAYKEVLDDLKEYPMKF